MVTVVTTSHPSEHEGDAEEQPEKWAGQRGVEGDIPGVADEVVLQPAVPEAQVEPLRQVNLEPGLDVPDKVGGVPGADSEAADVAAQLGREPLRQAQLGAGADDRV